MDLCQFKTLYLYADARIRVCYQYTKKNKKVHFVNVHWMEQTSTAS
jgi:hypothetical protein